mmetsp:Transcript_7888/g.20328  ORF Transcript_7888/g.20328 Transcript_7888/m.20328 type:complete len:346 (+) Transcript_7888:635-1672(+)
MSRSSCSSSVLSCVSISSSDLPEKSYFALDTSLSRSFSLLGSRIGSEAPSAIPCVTLLCGGAASKSLEPSAPAAGCGELPAGRAWMRAPPADSRGVCGCGCAALGLPPPGCGCGCGCGCAPGKPSQFMLSMNFGHSDLSPACACSPSLTRMVPAPSVGKSAESRNTIVPEGSEGAEALKHMVPDCSPPAPALPSPSEPGPMDAVRSPACSVPASFCFRLASAFASACSRSRSSASASASLASSSANAFSATSCSSAPPCPPSALRMNGCCSRSVVSDRLSGSFTRQAATNSWKSLLHLSGSASVGGGRVGITKMARSGWTSEYGGRASASSIAVIPSDQTSALLS